MKDLLKDVFERNCHFAQAGILDEIMNTIHPLSLSYKQNKTSLEQLIENYQITVEARAFDFVNEDREYAYARTQQKIKKVAGPELKDHILEQLIVFKQDDNEWKIWSSAILNIEYLD